VELFREADAVCQLNLVDFGILGAVPIHYDNAAFLFTDGVFESISAL